MHPWCTGCNLCMWEVSLTNAHSPWCPGWCPSGWGSLPAGSCHSWALPARYDDWVCRYPFPIYCKGCINVPLAQNTFLFSLLSSGVYQCISCTRSLSSFSFLSLGVYQGVFLLSGYAYTQVSPLLGKKVLYHCNVLKISQILSQILSKYHWKIVQKSSLDSFTSDTMLNDEIKSNILSSLYLQFIDTQGSKYMMIMMWSVQVLNQKMNKVYIYKSYNVSHLTIAKSHNAQ